MFFYYKNIKKQNSHTSSKKQQHKLNSIKDYFGLTARIIVIREWSLFSLISTHVSNTVNV